ncbi:14401_t:CDS:1, partial [Racocetra fulgida]
MWNVDIDYGETGETGVKWSYQFTNNGKFDYEVHRKSIQIDEPHYGHFYLMNNVKGFRINIRQELGFIEHKERKFVSKMFKRPVLVMQYPKLVHDLEISFKMIENFNDNFKKLAQKDVYTGPCLTLDHNNDSQQENNAEFNRKFEAFISAK